jgi:hypothetical protein
MLLLYVLICWQFTQKVDIWIHFMHTTDQCTERSLACWMFYDICGIDLIYMLIHNLRWINRQRGTWNRDFLKSKHLSQPIDRVCNIADLTNFAGNCTCDKKVRKFCAARQARERNLTHRMVIMYWKIMSTYTHTENIPFASLFLKNSYSHEPLCYVILV